MRVLLTGCAGFIGSHTAEALASRGAEVVGLDNFDPYYSPSRKRQNVLEVQKALGSQASFQLLEGDLRDEAFLDRVFAGPRFDVIIHLAAMPGVRASMDAPQLYVDVNLKATLALFDRAKSFDVGHVVFASTSSVYGATEVLPFVETDLCNKPLAPYPATKRAAELMAYSYHHMYGLPVTCLRFFTVYGPRGRPDMMTYKVVDSMFTGEEVQLYNGGQLLRDWTYVGDTAQGICAAAEKPLGYELINLGRGEPVVLIDYIRQLEKWSGRTANLVDTQVPRTDMERTCANIDKARALLGYEPKVSVAEGTKAFCEWYEQAVRG